MSKTYQSTLDIRKRPKALDDAIRLADENKFDMAIDLIENIEGSDAMKLKADILYKQAKVAYFPDYEFEKAMNLIENALETIPEGEDSSEMWFLKGEIYQSLNQLIDAKRCFLKAEGRAEELEVMEDELNLFEVHKNETLINITGIGFYKGFDPFEVGAILSLKRDAQNEHDPDAIAVLNDGEIVGYVANSDYTLVKNVKSASEINKKVNDLSKAEVLFVFQNEFVIAKVDF